MADVPFIVLHFNDLLSLVLMMPVVLVLVTTFHGDNEDSIL